MGVAGLAIAAYAQDGQPVLLEMRVTSVSPGRAVVDRGTLDGLELGDRVVFRLRNGGERTGRVIALEDRSATVEPTDASFTALPGMRVEARLPADRFELVEEVVEETAAVPSVAPEGAPEATPEHPPWERAEDGWTSKMPLLAKVQPFRPEDREASLFGRVYTGLYTTSNSEDDRDDLFFRLGGSATVVNPFGHGGRLNLEVDWDRRDTNVPDGDGDDGSHLRIYDASYAWGGDRFEPTRFEVGRFLHSEFPEFGVIDGIEWSRHFAGGGSIGASLGFVPEWDTLTDEGEHQEIAAWYRWALDESEVLTFGAGYQKTFQDLDADRDLFVLRTAWLPHDEWTFQATAWIDAYTSGDEAKGSGVEFTQAWVSLGRAWSSGSSVDITYRHLAFAETDREEFLPVTQAQLADDRYDRAAIAARQRVGILGLREEVGFWIDEDDEGGDGELAFDLYDAVFDGSHLEAAGFGSHGLSTTLAGWRAAIGADLGQTTLRFGYEFVLVEFQGFSSANNELPEHRALVSVDWNTPSGWSLSVNGEVLVYDEEDGIVASVFLQRSF
jgi:hypothetical protein